MKIKHSVIALIVMGLFMAETSAIADVTLNATDYSELDALRSQNSILKEQLANAELKSKIEAAKGIKAPVAATVGFPTNKATYIDRSARVELVEGIGTKLAATIQLSDGGNVIARAGMRISNLGFIKSIKTNEVLVQNGKETFSIPFLTENNTNPAQSQFGVTNQAPSSNMVVPGLTQPAGMN